ncbi:hypothetical protein SAMN05216488_2139 [Microbacterium sp. LKL04]|nr:hypothetical protein SAMN05216488_2139 [Microbacterium sp. LKL04]
MTVVALRRFAPLIIGAIGFAVLVVATVLRAEAWVLIAVLAGTLALAALAAARRPARGPVTPELSASDAYSDAYLGRTPPTHPTIETRPQGQYGPGLPNDPLHLPESGDHR